MYGGQLLNAAGKRTYDRSCLVRPAVHKQRRSGGKCRGWGCLEQSDHEIVDFLTFDEVRRGQQSRDLGLLESRL